MTNNYNASNYAKGSDGAKLNDENLKEMNASGKCNTCKYFHDANYIYRNNFKGQFYQRVKALFLQGL